MSMPAMPAPTSSAPVSSAPAHGRFNPYAMAHKVARFVLFRASEALGRADLGVAAEAATLAATCQEGIDYLRLHAHIEDEFFHPTLAGLEPTLERALSADHHDLEARVDGLERAARAFAAAADDGRRAAGLALLEVWNDFIARYTTHLRKEETEALSAWQRHFSDEQLAAMIRKVQTTLPPPMLASSVPLILQATANEDIAPMYAGMRASAPPPAVAGFEAAALKLLGPARFADLQKRVGA